VSDKATGRSNGPVDVIKSLGVMATDGGRIMTREYAEALAGYRDGKPMSVTARFGQGEWWRTQDGRWLRIAEMSAGHRYNTAAMLMRSAQHHAFRYAWGFGGEVAAHDGGDMAHESLERLEDEAYRQAAEDPRGWLRGTALYRALTAGLTIQSDGLLPWQAWGRDPVTGEPCEVPPRFEPVCEIPACGCSGKAHP
jgi:hypothetical protein